MAYEGSTRRGGGERDHKLATNHRESLNGRLILRRRIYVKLCLEATIDGWMMPGRLMVEYFHRMVGFTRLQGI